MFFVFFGLAMLVGQLMFQVRSIVFEVNAMRKVKVIRLRIFIGGFRNCSTNDCASRILPDLESVVFSN
jgi:hypothetical protein